MTRIALLLLATILAGGAHAQAPSHPTPAVDPATRAEAQRIIQSLKLDSVMDQTFAAIRPALVQQLAQAGRATPQQAEVAVDEVIMPALRHATPELMAGIADIWARHFSSAELRELGAFYETPVGRRWLQLTPQITAETQALTQSVLPRILNETVSRNRDALRQRGINL